ncbi:MAG: DEAD/DEAH box helicase [Candidatus Hodarchaeota archaeon]
MPNQASYFQEFSNWFKEYLEPEFVRISQEDPTVPFSWTQLQLFIIDLVDQQCEEKIRAGREDIYANMLEIYDKFKDYLLESQTKIVQTVPNARDVFDEEYRQVAFPCIFHRLLETAIGKPVGIKLLHVYDKHRIRSSAYELVSYLINLRQRLKESASVCDQAMLTHMVKVKSKQRMRPVFKVPFFDQLESYIHSLQFEEFATEEWSVLRSLNYRHWLLNVWRKFLSEIKIETIANFQWRCFQNFLDDALKKRASLPSPEPAIITAGTGFGKTEAFLFPILFFSLINLVRKRPRRYGPDAIFLYPRIDLCNDQLERCLWYAFNLKKALEETTETSEFLDNSWENPFRVAVAHSGLNRLENDSLPFSIACPICRSEGADGTIILRKELGSRYERVKPFCKRADKHSVGDLLALKLDKDTHYFCIAITTVDTLHRRLMDVKGSESLWRNKKVLPRFIVFDEIHVYGGQQGTHVANLCRRLRTYLKYLPPEGIDHKRENPLPPIMIASSATIGNPIGVCSHFFGVSEERVKARIFSPEDSESIPSGREHIILLKTPPHRMLTLPDDEDDGERSRFVSEQATLLQGVMALWHCMAKSRRKYRMLAFVDSIDSVWRITSNLHDAEVHRLFMFRMPAGRPQIPEGIEGGIFCPKFHSGTCQVPPHQFFETCRIYDSGECWWTMLSSPPEPFLRSMRILANSSGQRFSPNLKEKSSHEDWDCLVTTSTLEVGFDHPELIATAQFKAPPDPASFQQRKGRGGRAPEDTPITLVVLGNSPGDLFAFRNEKRFFDPSDKDLEIRVDSRNPYVRRQHILSAILDYFSWGGITKNSPDIYKKCDIPTLLQRIDDPELNIRNDLLKWLVEMYKTDGLSANDCRRFLAEAIQHLKNAVVNLSPTLTSRGVHSSLDLYRRTQIPPDWVYEVQRKVQQGQGGEVELRTLTLLKSAESFCKSRTFGSSGQEAYLHPPDYFSNLPIDSTGHPLDGSHVIPSSFVPTPIGGIINVKLAGHKESIVRESLLQMLSAFLPGGFKNRWEFKLWYGDWRPVPSKPGYADISDICRTANHCGTLRDLLGGRKLPPSLNMVSEEAELVEPLEIKVLTGIGHFNLDATGSRVALEKGTGVGPRLARDPSSAVQTFDLLVLENGTQSRKLDLVGQIRGFASASYGSLTLLRLFYANIVTAYLKDQSTRGMIVRFWDSERQAPAVPVARLSSQGIRVEGILSKNIVKDFQRVLLQARMLEEHYWRNVYRIIWRTLLLGDGFEGVRLPNAFDCVNVLNALKFMDYRAKVLGHGELTKLTREQVKEVISECADRRAQLDVALFRKDSTENSLVNIWDSFVAGVLEPAKLTLGDELVESFANTVGRVIAREVAQETNTNIDMLEVTSEVTDEGRNFRLGVYVYDQVQGGSGTVLSYVESVHRILRMGAILDNHKLCQTAKVEAQILDLLQDSKYNADILFAKIHSSLQGDTGEEIEALDPESRFKLRRLLASPEITAFYQGAAENYGHLRRLLNRVPTSAEVAVSLIERPISDLRGQSLVSQFSTIKGGIAELIPRVEEILPLCIGSCPDCLGDSRFSVRRGDKPIPDRFLTGGEGRYDQD